MNSQHKIRMYLEKHNIGAMFEELMTKLVAEMPCDPIAFLVRLLQQKMANNGNSQTVMSVSHLRNGIGDLTSALEIGRLRVHNKPLSASASKPRSASFKCPQSPHRKAVSVFFPEERAALRSAQLKPIRNYDRPEVTKKVPRSLKTPTFPVIAKVVSPKTSRRVQALCVDDFKENVIRLRDFETMDPLADETVFSSFLSNSPRLEKSRLLPHLISPLKSETGSNDIWKSRSVLRSAESVVEMYEDPCVMAEEGVTRVNCGRGLRVGGQLKPDDRACIDVSICFRCAKIMKLNNNIEGDDSSESDDKMESASQVNVPKMPHWTDESGASTDGGTANNSPRNAVVRHHKLIATPVAESKSYVNLSQTDELFFSSFHRLPVSPRRQVLHPRSPNLFLREASDDDEELYASKTSERPMPTVRVWEVFSDTDCKS